MTMTDLIERVKVLADEKDDYWLEGVLTTHPRFPFKEKGEDDPPPPPPEVELECLLRSMSEADLYTLFALHRLGQARIPVAEFHNRRELLRERVAPEWVFLELLQGAYLSAHLSEAAVRLRKVGVSIDDIQLAPA